MKKRINQTDLLILAYSFTLPVLTVLLCLSFRECAPFGGQSLISMDAFSQYYPMLMNMKEALKSGEMFYSFSGALGFNLFAQSAYYTNSPLWLIVYLLPHKYVGSAVDLLITFKIALAGVFFALRLIKKGKIKEQKKRFFVYSFLSVAYALSGYMVAFINQFMWTDVIVLLPLVILGLEELYEKKKPGLYVIALFFSIFSCFYISYMVCIFSCLYFLYLSFKEKIQFKEIFKKGVLFALASLIAGGMAAVVLLPIAKALGLTIAGDMGFTGELEIKYSLLDFLKRLLPFQKASLEFGEPNLYCSLFALLLMLSFFFAKKVNLREKIVSFIFVFFMSFSMCLNLGEFLWHGFHFPNQLPARQSFLLIFLVLSLAAKAAESLSLKKSGEIILEIFCLISAVIVMASFYSVFTNDTWTSQLSSLQRYESSIEKIEANIEDEGFYRMEWPGEKKNNLPQQCTYNGVCYYSSTMSADAYSFFENLGFEHYADRVSTHYTGSKITDDLFGIKYILEEKGAFKNEDERFSVTENENALPLGYLSEKTALNLDLSEYEAGEESREALLNSIISLKNRSYDEAIEYLKENGLKITELDTDYIRGTIKTEKAGLLLLTVPFDEGWKIEVDGEEVRAEKAAGYLLSCEIEKGEHEVELSYTVPGIKLGAIISLISLLGFVILITVTKKHSEI